MLFLHKTIRNDNYDEILEMKNENPCQNTICAENKFNKAQEPQNRLILLHQKIFALLKSQRLI